LRIGTVAAAGMLAAGGACAASRTESSPVHRLPPASQAGVDTAPFERPPIESNAGSYLVRVRFAPESVPLNEPFNVVAIVLDAATGAPVDAALSADAAMPAHGHGMNTRPVVRPLGLGRYEARGLEFHMPGRWELYLDLTRDGVTERAQMDVTLE
jgi:hypothetical protein